MQWARNDVSVGSGGLMRHAGMWLCMLIAVLWGCGDGKEAATPGAPAAGGADAMPPLTLPADQLQRMSPLMRNAAELLDRIHLLETQAGAADWSAARSMDERCVGMTFDDHAMLLRIEAGKVVLYEIWQRASAHAGDAYITSDDVQAVCPASLRAQWVGEQGIADACDDRLRSESMRLFLSVLFDVLTGEVRFADEAANPKPLDASAQETITDIAARIEAGLLAEAGEIARRRGSEQLHAEDVKAAFLALLDEFDMADVSATRATHEQPVAPDVRANLRALMVLHLDRTLRAATGDETEQAVRERVFETLSAQSHVHFTREGCDAVLDVAYALPVFMGTGLQPRRRDTDPGHDFDLPTEQSVLQEAGPRRAYLDLRWMVNHVPQMLPIESLPQGRTVVTAVVPHLLKEHGQTSLYFSPESLQEQIITRDDTSALRATGVHWHLLRKSLARSQAAMMDPVAAELLAERIVQSIALQVRLLEQMAKESDVSTIDAAFVHGKVMRAIKLQPRPAAQPQRSTDQQTRFHILNATYPDALFEDVSLASGIAQRVYIRDDVMRRDADIGSGAPNGSGVAVGDYDGDGLVDLFMPGDGNNRLYRNLGGFKFQDVTDAAGIDDRRINDARQALFVDVNNDGHLDLLIVHNLSPSRLYVQNADHTFTDKTEASGLTIGPGATTATWLDYDNDGDLDLYIGCYGATSQPGKAPPALDGRNADANQLFRNNADGTFTDVTAAAGVGSTAWTLACGAVDFSRDGLLDLYLANDFGADQLYKNLGDGRFEDVAAQVGVNDRGSGMNASFPDVNADGWPDIYVSVIDTAFHNVRYDLPHGNEHVTLRDQVLASVPYRSGNKVMLSAQGRRFAPAEDRYFERVAKGWSWGALFFDYENDGDDDMYLATGWFHGHYNDNDPNLMFLRSEDVYVHVKPRSPECFRANSRGAAAVDLDNDGAMDLVVSNFGSPPRVLRNVQRTDNHWIKVRLRGERNNRFGIGATLRAYAEGQPPVTRMVSCGSNYLSQDQTTVTIGLGSATALDRLEIHWPGGHTQVVEQPMAAGSTIDITESH